MNTEWAAIKRRQADQADQLAAVASGIGEYEIANACYRLAGLLRNQSTQGRGEPMNATKPGPGKMPDEPQ